MSSVDEFIDSLAPAIAALARASLADTAAAAERDARSFLIGSREALERWLRLLERGDITPLEFEELLRMRAGLARMHALTAAGLARQRIERFRKALVSLVLDRALSLP